MPEQRTPLREPGKDSNLLTSTPTKADNKNLDFSTNLSPIHSRASPPTTRNAMDLYAIIHESKKKIMKLRERNSSPTLFEKINSLQQSQENKNRGKPILDESRRVTNNKPNLPISENVLKMNSNSRSSTPDLSTRQSPNPALMLSDKFLRDSRPNTPDRMVRNSPGYRCSTPERIVDQIARNTSGSGSSTPERNVRIISEGPNWPKVIPASHVPNLQSSQSPTYDYLNLSPSGHYQKTRSPSPQIETNQYPSYPDYRSLPRMRRDIPQNSPKHFMPQSPGRQNIFSPRETSTLDRRLLSPQHSSLASDRFGKHLPTSRNNFKQLLLRANWGTTPVSGSAVERLKNKVASPVKNKSWKSDILSSTIPEDCREDDEQAEQKNPVKYYESYNEGIPISSALVNKQCKTFDKNRFSPANTNKMTPIRNQASPTDKNRVSPTLETAL